MIIGPRRCGWITALLVVLATLALGAREAAAQAIEVTPSPKAFGEVAVGGAGAGPDTVDIGNSAAPDLTITAIGTDGAADCDAFGFAFPPLAPDLVVAMGATVSFDVSFVPQTRGAHTCTVEIVSDTGGVPGTLTQVVVTGTGVGPELSVSPATLSFADRRVSAGASPAMTFTIENTGDTGFPLTVDDVALSGSAAFAQSGWPPADAVLAPGDPGIEISVTFDPATASDHVGLVTVTSADDPVDTDELVGLAGTGTEAVVSAPASRAFGDVVINPATPPSVTVPISNTGTATLTVDALAIGGADAAQFALSGAPATPFTIAAGAVQNITVVCDPDSVGSKAATLTIDTDADNAPQDPVVSLSCTGVKPDITVSPAGPLTFASTVVGQQSAAQNLSVANANLATTSTLTITAVQVLDSLGAASSDFTATIDLNDCPALPCAITPGNATTVAVRFTPTTTGARTGRVRITSDDQETPTVEVQVSGTGTAPEITLTQPAGGSIDFGDVQVGESSATQTVTVTNDGTANLSITAVSLGGANAGELAIASGDIPPPNITLVPGASTSWTVRCDPADQGNNTATLQIASNDADESPLNVALACRGIDAPLEASPSPLALGGVRLGESSGETELRLTNGGNVTMTVNSVTSSDAAFAVTTGLPQMPTTLAGGAFVDIGVTFTPTQAQAYSETLTISFTALGQTQTRVVTMTGTGLLAELTPDPASYDFGSVSVCGAPDTEDIAADNSGGASWILSSVSIDDTDNFAVQVLSPSPLPASVAPGGSAGIRVTAQPQTVGTHQATLTITTDIPADSTVTVPVQVTGTSPSIALSDGAIDFGAVDVQAQPETRTLTITNPDQTSAEPLTITELRLVGAGAAAYSLDAPALPLTVPVGGTAEVSVTYTPTGENGGEPAAQLEIVSDATCGEVSQVMLTGAGVDRHLALSATALDFGEVFRNAEPGRLTLDISNTGGAPLALTMVTPEGAPFALAAQAPTTVAPDGTETITVEFAPTAAGDFTGSLLITSDDDENATARVDLVGQGAVPNLRVDPATVSLGRIGVGIPVTVRAVRDAPILISNIDASSQTFTIREVRVVDEGGEALPEARARVLDVAADTPLAFMEQIELDVELLVAEPGPFSVTVQIFVDSDPEPVQLVILEGEALEIDVRGGGCSAGGDGAGLLVVLLLALVLVRRRATAVVVLVLAVLAGPARADLGTLGDATRDLELTTFRPTPGVENLLLALESPRVGAAGAWSVSVSVDHAVNPLRIDSSIGMTDVPVSARTAVGLGFAYAITDRIEAGLLVPVLQQSGEAPTVSALEPASGTALGDVAVHGKLALWQRGALATATSLTLTLPTATDGEFAGASGPSGHARGILGAAAGRWHVGVNGGVRVRPRGALGNIAQGHELTYGLAGGYRLQQSLSVVGELIGAVGLVGPARANTSPLELIVGARYRMSRALAVSAGVGRAVLGGIGAPDVRGFLAVSFAPGAAPAEPLAGLGGTGSQLDTRDSDGDGVIDGSDRCPREREDADGYDDDDGCPDLDNDGDGLADRLDGCPNEAEDLDGFEDTDGCPDLDNDGDKVADVDDACPMVPEDFDGFEDEDGCEEADNDRDGIPDVIDQCVNEAETINGNNDDDGCPDPGQSLVMVMSDRIELFEPVRFVGNTARVARRSYNLLGQVAATLRANRDILRVRIVVHVHPRNSRDQRLSDRRADAVKDWLIQWGVEPERLDVKGYGSAKPLAKPSQRGALEINDRVELILLETRVKK